MVLYRTLYDDYPGGGAPTEGFPGGPDSTYPAPPSMPTGPMPPFEPGGPVTPGGPVKPGPTYPGGGGGRPGGGGGGGGYPSSSPRYRFGPVPEFTYPEF